jgi:hypothetical protein
VLSFTACCNSFAAARGGSGRWTAERSRTSTKLFGALVAGATIAAILSPAEAQVPPEAPIDCPDVMPVSEITDGMLGTGWTVSEGRDPEPFDAEVLGVLPDAIAPGRDMIVVDTSSPAITEAGGIWFGMSGSPVYHDGRLMGALAFGLSFGPSSVAGLTPARGDGEALRPPVSSEPCC